MSLSVTAPSGTFWQNQEISWDAVRFIHSFLGMYCHGLMQILSRWSKCAFCRPKLWSYVQHIKHYLDWILILLIIISPTCEISDKNEPGKCRTSITAPSSDTKPWSPLRKPQEQHFSQVPHTMSWQDSTSFPIPWLISGGWEEQFIRDTNSFLLFFGKSLYSTWRKEKDLFILS